MLWDQPRRAPEYQGCVACYFTDENGVGTTRQEVDTITLTPGRYSIIGMPLITHRDPDDYVSQPLGNAGPRVSCGVVKLEAVATTK